MSNLIGEIARLKKQDAEATQAPWELSKFTDSDDLRYYQILSDNLEFYINFEDSDKNDPEFITEMRNAAPAMLEILSMIQPGDASILEYLVSEQENEDPDSEDRLPDEAIDMLKRLQAMCQKMEES
jgi:hypothetical protein